MPSGSKPPRHSWRLSASCGNRKTGSRSSSTSITSPCCIASAAPSTFTIGSGGPGQLTTKLRERLVGIQRGTVADADAARIDAEYDRDRIQALSAKDGWA